MKNFVPLSEASEASANMGFRVPPWTLQRAVQMGQIKAQKLSGRWFLDGPSFEQYVSAKLEEHAA